MFIDICQQLFSFHIFRIFVCASWTAVLLSPVSRDSLYNIAQQSHHCQQLFHLFSFCLHLLICLHHIASIRYSKPVSFINSIYGIGSKYSGEYTISKEGKNLILHSSSGTQIVPDHFTLTPENDETTNFDLLNVMIGINFHWQRTEDQKF